MDGDLKNVFPVAQLALIKSGRNRRTVLAQEDAQSAAAGRNDTKDFFIHNGAAGIICAGNAVFDALERIERGIIAVLIGDGADHEFVDLIVGERNLIGRR